MVDILVQRHLSYIYFLVVEEFFVKMWSQSDFAVTTENRFLTDRIDEMTRDGYQMAGKRRRQNTGQSDNEQRSVFMLSNGEDKLNIIFDEIMNVRINQEKTHQGMLSFQNSFRYLDESIRNTIEATNRNTDIIKTLAYKSIDQEARSRRNNLIFWGLAENPREDCFNLIRDFLHNQLDLDSEGTYLARAHRLGVRKPNLRNQRRPIIVNFRDFRDTEVIMSRAYMLRSTRYSIDYDLPKEIGDARKRLWTESKQIRSSDPRAKTQIVYPAKLLVDGKLVRNEFPDWDTAIRGSRIGEFSHISCAKGSFCSDMYKPTEEHLVTTHESHREVLEATKSPVNSNNRDRRKEPSDVTIIAEPMIIQQELEGVESFMNAMGADENQNNTTNNVKQCENSPSIFRPFDASSADKQPIVEQSPPLNTRQGYTVLNNENCSSASTSQIQSNKTNQNKQIQQERVSRPLIRGVRRSQSVSVSRESAGENINIRSKQEKPPTKNSSQTINNVSLNSVSREQENKETPKPKNKDTNTKA